MVIKLPAPVGMLSMGIAGVAISLFAALACATATPWQDVLGQARPNHSGSLTATSTQDGKPFVVDRVVGRQGLSVKLQADDLPEVYYEQHGYVVPPDWHLLRHAALKALMQSGEISLVATDGRRFGPFPVQPRRPLSSLPGPFWADLFSAAAAFLASFGVWVFRLRDRAAFYYALIGLSMLIFALAAAVFDTGTVVTDPLVAHSARALNTLFAYFAWGAFIAMCWHYPAKLGRVDPGAIIIAANVGLALANLFWRDMHSLDMLAQTPAYLLLLYLQWRRVRRRPVESAALRWFLHSSLWVTGVYMAEHVIQPLLGAPSSLDDYVFLVFLIFFGSMAAGILRRGLFQLDRWWFMAWSAFLGGTAVILLDTALVATVNLSGQVSLAASLLIVGWLYFPIRQLIWRDLVESRKRFRSQDLPLLMRKLLLIADTDSITTWTEALRALFQPLRMTTLTAPVRDLSISREGDRLLVPGHGGMPALELELADGGRRLFNMEDLERARTVHELMQRVLEFRNAVEIGVQQERERVARDLHDEVGARLLSLMHQADDRLAPRIADVVAQVREVAHSLGAGPKALDELIADLRSESLERARHAGVQLRWPPSDIGRVVLDEPTQLDLSRIVRECLSNALRHAKPSLICVTWGNSPSAVGCTIEHDGASVVPDRWTEGFGLRSVRARAAKLRGTLQISGLPDATVRISLRVPIAAKNPQLANDLPSSASPACEPALEPCQAS